MLEVAAHRSHFGREDIIKTLLRPVDLFLDTQNGKNSYLLKMIQHPQCTQTTLVIKRQRSSFFVEPVEASSSRKTSKHDSHLIVSKTRK